ncbi:zinc-binding dehydrogenase [Nocardia sp. BMG51109]|uniref:zinc-binding dehydrogenase n=1 Tax=Nocardia sp. BMG51109 TaxID=1056816 RepID=UPI0004BBA223|nr:zinc-binding dehydrogenase [Nocardia sp. BMG51109]
MTTATMDAVVLRGTGGPECLRLERVARPRIGPGEVLLRVAAFGINNAELMQRRGVVPAPTSGIPGLECAGTVVEVGPEVTTLAEGDVVAALTRSGSYAEYVAVHAGSCLRVPGGSSPAEASALPESAATAWWNLVRRGRIAQGDIVVVHGGAGGVGSVAVQLAAALGATVVATARGPAKSEVCARLGAHHVLDYGAMDVFAGLRSIAPGGVDVILDNQGGPALNSNLAALAPFGRLVVVGTQDGTAGSLDLADLMARAAEVSSSSLGKLTDEVRAALCRELEREVMSRVAANEIRPLLDSEFAFPDIVAAHERFVAPDRIGKVVVTVGNTFGGN